MVGEWLADDPPTEFQRSWNQKNRIENGLEPKFKRKFQI
jgi:hypothetical protein